MAAKLDLRKVHIAGSRRPSSFGGTPPRRHAAKKPLPLRARRRRVQAVLALAGALLISASVYGVSYASYLPQFNIQEISVVGTKELRPKVIEAYVRTLIHDGSNSLFSKNTVLGLHLGKIEEATSEHFLRTKSVKVHRESMFANAVMIEVQERIPYATWCGSVGDCYVLDDTGFLFAPIASSTITQEPYVFSGGLQGNPLGQSYITAHFPGVVALLRLLGQAGFSPKEFRIKSDKDFSVSFTDGFVLYASFGQDANLIANNLKLITSASQLRNKIDELSYIDMRFGDRVYYKLKGEERIGTTTER